MSHWKAGHKIQNGRYVIDKMLGYGGVGVTYRAEEKLTGSHVAIKTLNALIQNEPDFAKQQERFVQEAFCLARCTHPHIIKVENICQEQQLWCLVMEYIAGGTLQQYAQYKKGLLPEEALKYILPIGEALHHIHQQGFIHRDVKPGNIMVRKADLKAVLIDFGLAREFVQNQTQTHTNSRTESYAPIEQYEIRAKRGAYTDVYALAATLYYSLTLQLPFPAPFRQQGAALVPPKDHNPEISDAVNDVILLGMELIPEHRPQSIPEWLGLLTEAVTSSTSSSERLSVGRRTQIPAVTSSEPLSEKKTTQRGVTNLPQRGVTNLPQRGVTNLPSNPSPSRRRGRAVRTSKRVSAASSTQPQLLTIASSGVDYNPLQKLLIDKDWREADKMTAILILRLTKREKAAWIDESHLESLPCEDFVLIDRLWREHSKQQFGFSVQTEIYRKLGGGDSYDAEIWRKFAETVGWRTVKGWQSYQDLKFSLKAPQGHLPMMGMQFWGFRAWIIAIAKKLDKC
ncbi:MAG: serine/threonine-protein kinase [Microcystaceae cyanobacterium]